MTTYRYVNPFTGERVDRSERRRPGKDFRLDKIIPDAKPAELPPGCGACGADLEREPHAAACPVEAAQSQSPGLVAGDAGTSEQPPPAPPRHAQAADGAPPQAPAKPPRKSTAKGSK